MKLFVSIVILLLLSYPSKATDEVVDLKEVSLAYTQFFSGSHSLLLDNIGTNTTSALDLNINLSLYRYMYMNNTVHTLSDSSQYRAVGWEYALGVHLLSEMDLGLYHYSEHTLDATLPSAYPQLTGIQIKVYLYKKNKDETLF